MMKWRNFDFLELALEEMKGLLLRFKEKKKVQKIKKVEKEVKWSIYNGLRKTFHFKHCDSYQDRETRAYRIKIDGTIVVGVAHYLLGNRGVIIKFWVFARLDETYEVAWSWWSWRDNSKYALVSKRFKKILLLHTFEDDIFWGKFVGWDFDTHKC